MEEVAAGDEGSVGTLGDNSERYRAVLNFAVRRVTCSEAALLFHHPRRVQASEQRRLLSAGALAVPAPWPAAGPTLAFLQLLPGPANAAFSGHLLLGILDPADELVAGQRRDVLPGVECRGVGDQRLAQILWKLVHHPTGHSRAAHKSTVAGRGR